MSQVAVIRFLDYRLDRNLRRLYRSDGELIKLSPKPFDTLEFLVINCHRVVTKAELIEHVWQGARHERNNVVEQVVRKLRKLLYDDPSNPQLIETVPGGYRFIAPVFQEPESPGELFNTNSHSPAAPQLGALGPSEASPSRAAPGPRKRQVLWAKYFAAACVVAVGAAILVGGAPGAPAVCEVTVNTLIARDGEGREVWRKELPERLNQAFYATHSPLCQFADLNDDGIADVLFSSRAASEGIDSDTLYGFLTYSSALRGLIRRPERTITFAPGADVVTGPLGESAMTQEQNDYFPPYSVAGIFVRNRRKGLESRARIVVSSTNNNAPNQIAVLDGNLRKVSEYWHAGHLKVGQFDEYNRHDRIFLAGVNNIYRSATLVAFDPDKIVGTTNANSDLDIDRRDFAAKFRLIAAGTRDHLSPLGPGSETCTVLFSRTCTMRPKPYTKPYNRAVGLAVTERTITVDVAEGEQEQGSPRVTYVFNRNLHLLEAYPNTEFRQRHWEMEKAGLLDHSFSPDELEPLIHILPGCEFVSQ